jgi:DNA-binding MarR family transcriptional regulator
VADSTVAADGRDGPLGVWRQLLHYHRGAIAALDAELVAAHGVTLEEYDVLQQLTEAPDGRRRMGELAAATLIARSSCTRVVDRLLARGWVERTPDPADRRSVVVGLTAAGRTGWRACARTHRAGIDRWFTDRLTPADLAALRRALERLRSPRRS